AGFALAVILLFGYRLWPGIALGTFLEVVLEGLPVPIAFATAAGSAGGALAGAYLLNRMGFHNSLERLRDVLGLAVLGSMVSTTISATSGAVSFYLSSIIPWAASGPFWMTWWLGDVLGVIVVAPIVLVWSIRSRLDLRPVHIAEALALLTSLVLVSDTVFSEPDNILNSPYIMFPFLIWAALRFGLRGATSAIMIVSGIAIWHTAHGIGPFIKGTPAGSLGFLQVFTGVVALTILILAAVITEGKKSEEVLRESEESNRRLVDFSPYGIAIHSERKLLYVNLAGARILGASNPDELIGKTVFHFITPELHDIIEERILMEEELKTSASWEEKFLRLDGTSIDVEVVSIPFTFMRKPAMYTVFQDITERKKAEKIHLENLRLEAADKAKSEFFANMSHELRTPLNASIGFSELLIMGMAGKLNEKQKQYVDNIFASNKFLLTLINDILDLSKIEAGKIELVPEKISLPVTINETLTLIKEKAIKHNVLIKTEFEPGLESIEADKQRVKQVLFNLLNNAVKFSKDEGGTITITAKKEGGMAKISVSDTGIGIKDENTGKLFQKFEQLDPGISKKYGGTGLGLAITKHLVELHGGNIRVESMYGEGSTFTFTLPIEPKERGET
ncbi:MAG: MASE1 domain-containing protein, partial [Candidatus Methanoperedens sp.]|nr:MASE1 domain-containing protein [Candidatus Methanoperedens sp.]